MFITKVPVIINRINKLKEQISKKETELVELRALIQVGGGAQSRNISKNRRSGRETAEAAESSCRSAI